jgi:PHP family Zn ribbon phosphoesterase
VIRIRADLHVHTVLSPCAEVEMIPPLIVREALDLGINLIAITDHNSSANIESVQKAAKNTSLIILPGMELQTREEVHVLCLFDTLEQIKSLQEIVDASMPEMMNDIEHFGEQFVVDETGDFIRREERLLITSSDLTLTEAYHKVTGLGGWLVPAHVNRKTNGLLSILGFVPVDIPIDTLEISSHLKPAEAYDKFPQIRGYPLLQDGDVHLLGDFAGTNEFFVNEVTIQELRMAVHQQEGRSHRILN